jgi:formylglycine-generating enzyme required for sulfatase activity
MVGFLQFIAAAGLALMWAVAGNAGELAPLTADQERALKPKDTFQECADCPAMVVVPAGAFRMGSLQIEKNRSDREGPVHNVTIARPFAVGKVHVTVAQFAAFVSETGYDPAPNCFLNSRLRRGGNSWADPGFAQEGSRPVVCVSWAAAKTYADWLSKKTGKPYRMLSEAEFEYAARGQTQPGTYPRFWFGDDEKDLCKYGNFSDHGSSCNDGYEYTSPAGHYQPNAFGLYDMFGNAWQWAEDCWHPNYNGAPVDGSAWTTNCIGSANVVRGGSWHSFSGDLRAAARGLNAVEIDHTGFRLARTLTP